MTAAKPTSSRRSNDKYVLRFPDGMRDDLKQRANSNGRSMNREIELILSGVAQPLYETSPPRSTPPSPSWQIGQLVWHIISPAVIEDFGLDATELVAKIRYLSPARGTAVVSINELTFHTHD